MRKVLGLVLVLAIGTLVFVPSPAAACRTCDVPSFWGSDCSQTGCTYCAACTICCGGNPDAGGNCALYCGGGDNSLSQASELTSFAQIFLTPAVASNPGTQVPSTPVPAQSSTARQ